MTTGKKLTEAPGSLKEAVDWVLCISGNYGDNSAYSKGQEAIKNLAAKAKGLLTQVTVEEVTVGVAKLFNGDTSGNFGSNAPIASLAGGLKHLIEEGNGIGNSYAHSYSYEDISQSVDTQIVNIFLSTIPLLFFGLGFLFWKCQGGWKTLALGSGPLKSFMDAVGFTGHIDTSKPAFRAYNWFTMFDELKRVESVNPTFPEYLREVEKHSKRNLNSNPNNVPLGTLYLFTYQYLKTQRFGTLTTTDDGVPNNENDITTLLNELSTAMGKLGISQSDKLSTAYTNLADAITTALKTPDPVEESSVTGPLTGTLATAGLLGGGSAVYFNVGGAGSFLKGLFNFH
ncbi:variant erythrocyte surface antigen-1 family protein [Babesia caballi]|uniref:Variant erythrocyte surface antigen-1 family protein n=1 Tax=Babesia caballi TaxID=5871 RepID=A0AAV4LXR9_BABCB|nr:variant erythrocyte surface antigen-1 family protein [Babesia caballi]